MDGAHARSNAHGRGRDPSQGERAWRCIFSTMKMLVSRKRSAQLVRQSDSQLLSRVPGLPMHLSQHVSVSFAMICCTAAFWFSSAINACMCAAARASESGACIVCISVVYRRLAACADRARTEAWLACRSWSSRAQRTLAALTKSGLCWKRGWLRPGCLLLRATRGALSNRLSKLSAPQVVALS
eukprot:IDg19719t1